MFSFPEGSPASSTPAGELAGRARLVVEVPHWTTVVSMVDHELRAVEGLSRAGHLPKPGEAPTVSVEVGPGAYNIEAKLGGQSQTMWVVAQADHETRVPSAAWNGLTLATSMPLAGTIDGTPADDPILDEARRLSGESAPAPDLDRAAAAGSRLFILGRFAAHLEGRSPSSWKLALLDARGEPAADLGKQDPVHGTGYWSATFDLPAGHYALRAREVCSTGSLDRFQPLHLCDGWEHHLFLHCDQSPRLATMSFGMSPLDTGFRPDEESTIATAALLSALADEDPSRALLGASQLRDLLDGDFRNPWLWVLAGYALATADASEKAGALLAEIRTLLGREIGDHPDARALLLGTPASPGPPEHTPMLRAGLQLARTHLPPGAQPGRPGRRIVADSAWTAWVERVESDAPRAPADDAPEILATSTSMLAQALPSSAAIYPLGDPFGNRDGKSRSMAEQVAIIDVAETVLNLPAGEAPESFTIAAGGPAQALLAVDAEKVSRFTGIGISEVENGFSHLSRPIEEFGLEQDEAGVRAMHEVLSAVLDVKRCASIENVAATPEQAGSRAWWLSTPLEDHIDRLRQEASRLRNLPDRKFPLKPDQVKTSLSLATRLETLADHLTAHAHLVIIADKDGELRYGNKLLYDRLQMRADPADVLGRLHEALGSQSRQSALIPAARLSPTSPEGMRDATVEVHRTKVHDEHDEVKAYIYLLRDAAARKLTSEDSDTLETLLPVVTLHAATAQHGEGDVSPSLTELSRLLDELENILLD